MLAGNVYPNRNNNTAYQIHKGTEAGSVAANKVAKWPSAVQGTPGAFLRSPADISICFCVKTSYKSWEIGSCPSGIVAIQNWHFKPNPDVFPHPKKVFFGD